MTKNNENNASVKFNSQKEGIRIVKIAAFCFAIVSWFATAQGLNEYVFQNHHLQAAMISFAIQSILFVFNLKLPEYFEQIGKRVPDDKRVYRKYHFGKRNGTLKSTFKWTQFQKIIAFFYAAILFSSSFFSFVYMTNLVYTDTRYIDANIVLDRTYRTYLNDTDKYIDEFAKAMQINAGELLSELKSTSSATNSNNSAKSNSQLKKQVSIARRKHNNAIAKETAARDAFNLAKSTYETPMNVRWRDKTTLDLELKAYKKASSALTSATKNKNLALQKLNNAKQALNEYKPDITTTVHDLLVEILKTPPDTKNLNDLMTNLNDIVVKIDEDNFTEIMSKTQKLTITIDNYLTLKTIQSSNDANSIKNQKNAIFKDNTVIPVPSSKDFDEQKTKWESSWKSRFLALEKIIKNIPNYSKSTINSNDTAGDNAKTENKDLIVDMQLLDSFNTQKITNRIDKITRSNLSNINALERAFKLLISDFPFLAWFSLLLALFFDLASLLAGLFIYLTSPHKSIKDKTPKRKEA